jgi:hypothetical protein
LSIPISKNFKRCIIELSEKLKEVAIMLSLGVTSEMRRRIKSELERKVDIPNVDMSELGEALAQGICKGLEKYDDELWRKLENYIREELRRSKRS